MLNLRAITAWIAIGAVWSVNPVFIYQSAVSLCDFCVRCAALRAGEFAERMRGGLRWQVFEIARKAAEPQRKCRETRRSDEN
jgi:hypothetical protein